MQIKNENRPVTQQFTELLASDLAERLPDNEPSKPSLDHEPDPSGAQMPLTSAVDHAPHPAPHVMLLTEMAEILGVSYQSLIWAHKNEKLALVRDVSRHNDSLSVTCVEVIKYAINGAPPEVRWNLISVPVKDLVKKSKNRLRNQKRKIKILANYLRDGGQLSPLFVRRRPDGRFDVIDGDDRTEAARQARLEFLPAFEIKLPEKFVADLPRSLNTTHGVNLTEREQVPRAVAYLRGNTKIVDGLRDRTIRAEDIAEAVGVSPSTISRAVQEIDGKHQIEVDSVEALRALRPILEYVEDHPEDVPFAKFIVRRVAAVIAKDKDDDHQDIAARLKRGTTQVARLIHKSPLLRTLIDRRGGDRRSKLDAPAQTATKASMPEKPEEISHD